MGQRRRRGRTRIRKPNPTLSGIMRVARPGSASVKTAEGVFQVARGGIREAMDGDEVQVVLVNRGAGARQAVVCGVLQRAISSYLGVYEVAEPLGVIVPLDARLRHDFFVLPEDDSPARLSLENGDVVVARILEYPTRQAAGVATIERKVGRQDDLDMSVETVIASYGLSTRFPLAAQAEADELVVNVEGALASESSRRDLRSLLTFTIDPADARDFDDALSVRKTDQGGYELGVHIADVTHYVAWGSSLDLEARLRTCSTYLVDRVLPMFPERLCNDVCSLRPKEDRLSMTVLMKLNKAGEVVSYEAFRSAICSCARLSYDEVDRCLEEPNGPHTKEMGEELLESLALLDEIAQKRALVRQHRGAIDFETREAKVLLDEKGHPTEIVVRKKTRATSLVEEAMLLANECVAQLLVDAGAPAAFRVHERPAPENLQATIPILRELGVVQAGDAERIVAGDPEAIRLALEKARGTTGEYLANAMLLRAQKRAVYLPHNDGHYALGAKAYCHFTSPIRRYPDVIVHRALKAVLDGQLFSPEQKEARRALPQLCRTCSDQERIAEMAARDTQKAKMAELYASRIGERYSGIVVGCERYGLFVMLDDDCAEGLLPTRALGEEWFTYDETHMALVGQSSGRSWRLGQRLAVEVQGAVPERGQIDFKLAQGR